MSTDGSSIGGKAQGFSVIDGELTSSVSEGSAMSRNKVLNECALRIVPLRVRECPGETVNRIVIESEPPERNRPCWLAQSASRYVLTPAYIFACNRPRRLNVRGCFSIVERLPDRWAKGAKSFAFVLGGTTSFKSSTRQQSLDLPRICT